ncbi:hypothetical protein H5410_061683 [Solanum commersonii]|uniref:Uncharacterized protein n=1 Tax=Solanum commersonii TaxID=4109 RepID=A0A9J5W8J8_SOLCO|nr:hypothetical protein H5410_061683 [Solanum commersonii]
MIIRFFKMIIRFKLQMVDGEDHEGFPEDQATFLGKLGTFYPKKAMEFKPPRFYGHQLNRLKLWRSVIRLGGYDQDLHYCFLDISFYEKFILQYERHRTQNRELQLPIAPPPPDSSGSGLQIFALGRAVRDLAARCRLGWQEQHLLGYGEVVEPIVKDRNANNTPKRAKCLKNISCTPAVFITQKKKSTRNFNSISLSLSIFGSFISDVKINCFASARLDVQVVDVGPPDDWVKINVREINDSFEVYALVPGLLRDEVRVQSDPAGRLVITVQPNQLDNLWGVTGFKKVHTLLFILLILTLIE